MRTADTIERSDLEINRLIEERADLILHDLTVPELVGWLAVPTVVSDVRGIATQPIFIAGGAASGKSTLAAAMAEELPKQGMSVAAISTDDYVLWDRKTRQRKEQNGILPSDKYNFELMGRVIGLICGNQKPNQVVKAPRYNSHTGRAINGGGRQHISSVNTLIVEGDMYGEEGQSPQWLYPAWAADPLTVYLHTPDAVRLARRMKRDEAERNAHGGTRESIAASFALRQETQHFPYTLTYAQKADIILRQVEGVGSCGEPTYDVHFMQR